jgi:hypothetical protein
MIQCRHAAGEQERRFVRKVAGHAKAEMGGRMGHGRYQRHRIEQRDLHAAAQ